ncbi:X-linked retinitis pigmentosa GTPase regulator-interacting protein 1-like [Mobula birostris]|uniref:X-linked retinitis pigmentosa GTPase regulator-interacting protein 1-like n=1 Tax=Mobula birostris TaxID=1983395 RepID=UPI003B28C14E
MVGAQKGEIDSLVSLLLLRTGISGDRPHRRPWTNSEWVSGCASARVRAQRGRRPGGTQSRPGDGLTRRRKPQPHNSGLSQPKTHRPHVHCTGRHEEDAEQSLEKRTGQARGRRGQCEPPESGLLEALVRLLEPKMEGLRRELRDRAQEHEEALLQLRRHQVAEKRESISKNMETIRVKKQLSDVSVSLLVMERRYSLLQQYLNSEMESQRRPSAEGEGAVSELREALRELREERELTRTLGSRLEQSALRQRQLEQLQVEVEESKRERELLKEGYDALVASSLEQEQEQKNRGHRIRQLELDLQGALQSQQETHSKLQQEVETSERLRLEVVRLQLEVTAREGPQGDPTLPAQVTQRQLNPEKLQPGLSDGRLGWWMEAETSGREQETSGRELLELQVVHAETVQELSKMRTLLLTENQISRHCQSELELLTERWETERQTLTDRLQNRERLLELRAAQTRSLEDRLMKACGPRGLVRRGSAEAGQQASGVPVRRESAGTADTRLLEIQLLQAELLPRTLRRLGDPDPVTFCSHGLYDFATQCTELGRGRCPRYRSTSLYAVPGQRGFLRYLRDGSLRLEMHRAWGADVQTLGSARLALRGLLEEGGTVWGRAPIEDAGPSARLIGWLEYGMRLTLPENEGIRLDEEGDPQWIYLPTESHQPDPSQIRARLHPELHGRPVAERPARTRGAQEDTRQTVDIETQTPDDRETQSSDSDELIHFPLSRLRPEDQRLRVEVLWLSLRPDSPPARDPDIRQLFVEFCLPGVAGDETPTSLPTPRRGERIYYHWCRVIPLDPERDAHQRQFLYAHLQGGEPDLGRLRFTVVSEPLEEDSECEDVGYSHIPLAWIHETGQDIVQQEFDILDAGRETDVIGTLSLSVEGAPALRAVSAEFSRKAVSSARRNVLG